MMDILKKIINGRNTKKNCYKTTAQLDYYKNNFYQLDDIEKSFYKNTLKIILEEVKSDAAILNTTTEIEQFVKHWNLITERLKVLSGHEFSGYFQGMIPSKMLETIMQNKHLTEIKFIKRSFRSDNNDKYVISENESAYLHSFSPEAIHLIENGHKAEENKDHALKREIPPKKETYFVDPYFIEAGKIVIEKNKGSVGMLQRILKINFNRSLKIMDQLEYAGVVGPEEGTKPRKALMNIEEFQNLLDTFSFEYKYSETTPTQIVHSCMNDYNSERISMYNNKFDFMEGHDFEHFCAGLLIKNGFSNVEVTQGSGDHGIDILAEKDDITYAIQCKCYAKDIGNAAVQQAHTGKSIYKKDIAVVLTNRDFTLQAKEEAKMLSVKLWNREKLLSLINSANS